MKCLLISLSGCPRTPSDFIPDNGLAQLAGVLKAEKHQVEVLDYNTPATMERLFPPKYRPRLQEIARQIFELGTKPGLKTLINLSWMEKHLTAYQKSVFREIGVEIAEKAAREKVDFVGLKLWNGDGFTASLTVAEVLKKRNPRLAVFGGGPQVDTFRNHIFQATDAFDGLVYGEGEETILELLDCVRGTKNLAEVSNLIFRKGDKIIATKQKWLADLNQLPYALYDPEVYPAMAGDNRLRFIVVEESRGCPFACSFCPHPAKSGRPKTKTSRRIAAEIDHFQKNYGVSVFRYSGSNPPYRLLAETAREIIKRNLRVEYTAFSDLRQEKIDFRELKKSGCFGLFFGVESADPQILNTKMNKKAVPEKMAQILTAAREAGIFTVASFIVPAPGETEQTIRENLDFLSKTRPDAVITQFPGVYPGTQWAQEPEKFGFTIPDKRNYPIRVMNYKIRGFFPPRFWDPLPYRVDGKSFRQFAGETEHFNARVEQELGIVTGISDDIALIAKHLGCTPRDFRNQARRHFFTGDAPALQEMIRTFNRNSADRQ